MRCHVTPPSLTLQFLVARNGATVALVGALREATSLEDALVGLLGAPKREEKVLYSHITRLQ